ncbi:MAG TPA: hypothetical protein DCR40_01070 [Prolixibacteraceae bacterium]|nr:hypothetical protein [Prolixibacteraceae bacterium]
MQTKFLISVLLLLVSVPVFSQSTSRLPPFPGFLKKGVMTLNDGSPIYYKQLQLRNDSVFYQDYNLNAEKTALLDISQITKNGSYAGIGALSGCGLGLLAGIGIAKAMDDTGDLLSNVFTLGQEPELDTRKEETSMVIFSTLIGTGIGALAGALFSKNIIVFSQSIKSISFTPSFNLGTGSEPEFVVSCRITFR